MRALVVLTLVSGGLAAPTSGLVAPTSDNQAFVQESQGLAALQTHMADFAQSMYLHLAANEQDNFVFSPLSLHSALTMLYLGTTPSSTTEAELMQAMGHITSRPFLQAGYKQIVKTYKEEMNLMYGNNFWVQDGISIGEEFKTTVARSLNCGIDHIDFAAENSTDTVNQWVEKMTGGKIDKIVDELSPNSAMFLANALYFKEDWLVPFDDVNFRNEPLIGEFDTGAGKVNTRMIQQKNPNATFGEIRLFQDQHAVDVISLPYENDLFEMQIILPRSAQDFKVLETKMNLSQSRDLTNSQDGFFNVFSTQKDEVIDSFDFGLPEVNLRMPTFQVRSNLDLVPALRSLGVDRVFTSGAELGELAPGGEPFGVSKISHSALVEVTKEGTEGAAATGAEIVLLSATFGKDITVDRPFIFVVQDKRNNIPVLIGRVTDPTKKIP